MIWHFIFPMTWVNNLFIISLSQNEINTYETPLLETTNDFIMTDYNENIFSSLGW